MKTVLSEFVLTHKKGSGWDTVFYADVTVTTSGLFTRTSTKRCKIAKGETGRWYFVDNG